MSKLVRTYIAFMLMFSAGITTSVLASAEAVPDIDNVIQVEAYVDGLVVSQLKRNHIASGVVTLMKGGNVIFSKGYGYQDVHRQVAVDPLSTIFRIGSISKLFTWVSVMQQVEKGNLDLDANVNQYLSTFQIPDTWPGQPVTLRHIMSHTAGFEDGGLGYLLEKNPEDIVPLAQSVARYMPKRVTPPGLQTAYSNWATALAGLIVSNVSGMDFNDYVRQHIFDVLGMDSATFVEPLPPRLSERMAKSYGWKAGQFIEEDFEIIANLGPSGSASASSSDMIKFGKALLGGGEIINSEGFKVTILERSTTELMLSHLHSHDSRIHGMAYGFAELPYVNGGIVGHDGATNVFFSHFGISLQEDLMLFTSFSGPGAKHIHSIFKESFYNYFFPQSIDSIESFKAFTSPINHYEGTYQPWRANFTKVEKIVGALQSVRINAMPDNTLLVNNVRYIPVDKNLFREDDGFRRIAFQENDAGEITGYTYDGAAGKQMYKAPFHQTLSFIILIIVPAFIVFAHIVLRRLFQGQQIAELSGNEKLVFYSSLFIALFNILFLLLFSLSFAGASNRELMAEFPWLLKLALIFPILAFLATIHHVYQTIALWRKRQGSVVKVLKLSLISVCGVAMTWLYWNWNLLGFHYLS